MMALVVVVVDLLALRLKFRGIVLGITVILLFGFVERMLVGQRR